MASNARAELWHGGTHTSLPTQIVHPFVQPIIPTLCLSLPPPTWLPVRSCVPLRPPSLHRSAPQTPRPCSAASPQLEAPHGCQPGSRLLSLHRCAPMLPACLAAAHPCHCHCHCPCCCPLDGTHCCCPLGTTCQQQQHQAVKQAVRQVVQLTAGSAAAGGETPAAATAGVRGGETEGRRRDVR